MVHIRPSSRSGFTLVELLVVIAIIGVLMGLLLPAVQSAREAGRRTTCQNNQYQLALAAVRFNDTNGFLPGWRNSLPHTSGTFFPSWPVMVLPFMERIDIYRSWSTGVASAPYVSAFVCPSSPPDAMTTPLLAYAGNCGMGNSVRANGVMVDASPPFTTPATRLALDDVSNQDGTAMTLIFSEKCITGTAGLNQNYWDMRPNVSGAMTFANPSATYAPASTVVPGFGVPLSAATVPRIINNATIGGSTVAGQSSLPSSNHPGGAVAAFCDGRTSFLKDSLSFWVYAQLLSSDEATASNASNTTPAAVTYRAWTTQPNAVRYTVLSEGDFQ